MTTHNELSEIYEELLARLGGPENATDAQKQHCRVAANLCRQIDVHMKEFLTIGDLDIATFVPVIHQLCDELDHLGINDPSDFCRDRIQ